MAHISTQTGHMMDIATSTVEAAQVEDAIGSTGNLDHVADPEVQVVLSYLYSCITLQDFYLNIPPPPPSSGAN